MLPTQLKQTSRARHDRKRRGRLRNQGICTTCRKAKAVWGLTNCEPCRLMHALYSKDYYQKRVATHDRA